jgi:hypothetical protein
MVDGVWERRGGDLIGDRGSGMRSAWAAGLVGRLEGFGPNACGDFWATRATHFGPIPVGDLWALVCPPLSGSRNRTSELILKAVAGFASTLSCWGCRHQSYGGG